MRPLMTVWMVLTLAVPAFATDYTIASGYYGTKTYRNYDTLLMTGGGVYSITAEDYSFLDIRNTSPYAPLSGGIGTLDLTDRSQMKFSGGAAYEITVDCVAYAILSGGQINRLASTFSPNTHQEWNIEVICKNWDYNTTTKILTGTWQDNSAFNIQLVDVSGYRPTIDTILFVPEPATLLLIGAGGMFLRRKW